MRIGFIGTRMGMTAAQLKRVNEAVDRLDMCKALIGDRVGADVQFASLAYARLPATAVDCFPIASDPHRAELVRDGTTVREPSGEFEAYRQIISEADTLIIAPREMVEQQPRGTWYSAVEAGRVGKRTIVVLPDGNDWDGVVAAKPKRARRPARL